MPAEHSLAMFRAAFNHSPAAIFYTAPEGRILAANPAACTLLGYSEDELRALGRSGVVAPDTPRLHEMVEERNRTGRMHGELILIRRDGLRLTVATTSEIFLDDDGALRTIVVAVDRTPQREVEEGLRVSEARYRAIVEAMDEGVVFQGADGQIISTNPAAERIEGREAEEMLGRTSDDPGWGAIHPDGSEFPGPEHPAMVTLRTGQPQRDVVMGILTPHGRRRWISINSAPVFEQDATTPSAVVTTFHDITRQHFMEEQLRIASIAFEESQEAMLVTTPDGAILRVNKAFTRLTGYAESEAVGRHPREYLSALRDIDLYEEMVHALAQHGRWEGEVWQRRRGSSAFPAWLSMNSVVDGDGGITHYVATFIDLTGAKQAEADIHTLAYFDGLTRLANRRLLLDRLDRAVIQSSDDHTAGGMLLLDLDDFTVFNDTRSHEAGDALLLEVAERLNAITPADATLARTGPDEFAMLVPGDTEAGGASPDVLLHLAQQALASLERPIDIDDLPYLAHASIGIATFADGSPSAGEVMRRADAAVLQSQRSERDEPRFFDAAMHAALEARVHLETELRRSIPDRLVLHYQPQTDARGNVIGAEALIRWQHPDLGLMAPSAFIPIAEEDGLILPIGQFVLEAACRTLASWAQDPQLAPLTLSINVSPKQIRLPEFAHSVLDTAIAIGADPSRLCLEITESALLDDLEGVARTMQSLRDIGVAFALDDFGTGYASLQTLKGLPMDHLKVDQAFVRDLTNGPSEAAFVRAIITLGQTLGMSVIAEGVETEEQRRALVALGCDALQGFHILKPAPLDAFEEFVRSNAQG